MTQQRSPDPNFQSSLENLSMRESYRNRQILLNKVRNYWLTGVLEKSLQGNTSIELALEERLDAIESPLGRVWETPAQARKNLPPGTRAIAKFDQMGEGRSLLILGEPGSGKTTLLLELTRDLLQRAERDIHAQLPVVFNLSSWKSAASVTEKQTIAEWLVAELHTHYQIPKSIAQVWIKTQQLLLLLDGLDEVAEEDCASCIRALNQFLQEHGRTELVVCSRLRDYEVLPERLRVQSAICIQPLTLEQVNCYLAEAGSGLEALRTILQDDATLAELATTPLMLNIMTLAYQGMSIEDLSCSDDGKNVSTQERRKHLFNAYIQRMLTRRNKQQPYTPAQLLHWLSEMGYRMSEQSQTVLFIERLQPSWLRINLRDGYSLPFLRHSKRKTSAFKVYVRGLQLVNGLMWGVIITLYFGLIAEPSLGIQNGLIGGFIAGLITNTQPIKPIESLKWSWGNAKQWLPIGLVLGASGWVSGGPFWGSVLGLSGVLFTGLMGSALETTTIPNQGIWQSLKNASIFSLVGGLLCLMGGAGLQGSIELPELLSISILTGGISGLILGLSKGGKACLQHFILRIVLSCYRYSPWNYARFLNYAAERNFLQKVGGGYIFMHRLLQEHFAALKIEHYIQTFSINQDDAEAYLQRGKARASIGDSQQAIVDFTQAIELDPSLAEAYAERSLARYRVGDYLGVVEDYDRTVELNPTLAKATSYTANSPNDLSLEAARETTDEISSDYLVILLNDDFNTFTHVSDCLIKYIPGMTRDRAWHFTHKVHNEGQVVVWSGCQELAALYRMQLTHAGLSIAFLEKKDD
ncbi:MAG TPA: ATP-dependent Clp protease adaptor ClpS [Coleofasciculaceae cyanobacterium]